MLNNAYHFRRKEVCLGIVSLLSFRRHFLFRWFYGGGAGGGGGGVRWAGLDLREFVFFTPESNASNE